jgi:Zn-dependent alcohol dehydrogenase
MHWPWMFECSTSRRRLPNYVRRLVIRCNIKGPDHSTTATTHSAVDTNPRKEAFAKKFGGDIVEFVNPSELPEGKTIQDYLVEITDGGLDFTFDATGNVSIWRLVSTIIAPLTSD